MKFDLIAFSLEETNEISDLNEVHDLPEHVEEKYVSRLKIMFQNLEILNTLLAEFPQRVPREEVDEVMGLVIERIPLTLLEEE